MKVIMICQILQDYPIHSKGIIRYRRTNQDRKIQMLPYSLLSAFIHVCCFFSVVLFKLQLYSWDPFVFCMYIKLVSMVELIIAARIWIWMVIYSLTHVEREREKIVKHLMMGQLNVSAKLLFKEIHVIGIRFGRVLFSLIYC